MKDKKKSSIENYQPSVISRYFSLKNMGSVPSFEIIKDKDKEDYGKHSY